MKNTWDHLAGCQPRTLHHLFKETDKKDLNWKKNFLVIFLSFPREISFWWNEKNVSRLSSENSPNTSFPCSTHESCFSKRSFRFLCYKGRKEFIFTLFWARWKQLRILNWSRASSSAHRCWNFLFFSKKRFIESNLYCLPSTVKYK